jgi:hypothetical protein
MACAGIAGTERCIANIGQCADQGIDRRHTAALVRAHGARMKQLPDLLADYPAFEAALEAFPDATEAVISADLPADLAAERDALLRATAQLWQAWRDLGAKIRTECYPTIQ